MIENKDYSVAELFPCPVYTATKDSNLDSTTAERRDIEDIIKEGMITEFKSFSNNTYIFNTKLHEIKEFCEQHIKNYVEKIINPKEKNDIYITQSWLNVNKPGEVHHPHIHANSIISGVFYVQTVENDNIVFYDPSSTVKSIIQLTVLVKEQNRWNSDSFTGSITPNMLVLFPSWMHHGVPLNEKQTTDRISISFNTFSKTLGGNRNLNQLIL
jgi:uncharacterized protein (TIGR02466 family)